MMDRIIHDMYVLSSVEFSGRLSGTEGARKAAEFLASALQSAGFSPAGEDGYFSKVNVPASRLMAPAFVTIGGKGLHHRIDFAEYSPFSSGGSVTGELITIRDGDDVSSKDLAGKIVLIPERPNDFDVRGTINYAASLGVAALLIESGEPESFHKTIHGSDKNKLPVLRIRRSLAQKFSGKQGLQVSIEIPLEMNTLPCKNVLGILPGVDTRYTLALTAHYDHLGDDPKGVRFPGTIDNASGVAVMLEVARMLAKREQPLPFTILVAFLTGEESGLWGAKHLASNPPVPLSAVINLDCLGFEPELFALRTGHKASIDWLTELASDVIKNHGIDVRWIAGGDDSVAFIQKGIPTIGLGQKPTLPDSTNIHTLNDNPDNLHMKPIEKGFAVVFDIVNQLVDSPFLTGIK
jgi:Iap family predicted aminopeptidase